METKKTKVGKFLQGGFMKNVLAPILRGVVKSVPVIGTPAVEIITNLTQPKTMIATTTGDAKVEVEKPLKHNYISIAIQVFSAIAVGYAFYTKAITVEQVLTLLKGII